MQLQRCNRTKFVLCLHAPSKMCSSARFGADCFVASEAGRLWQIRADDATGRSEPTMPLADRGR